MTSPFARLPSVAALLADPGLAALPHAVAKQAARDALAAARDAIRAGELPAEDLAAEALRRARSARQPHLRRVINATGVVVHTNLGRAPLPPEAAAAVARVAAGYSNLELDLATGQRGERLAGVVPLLRQLTGAEDAVVVNNCAAAVLLTLTALARGGEVIASRGELVEIGGSFRVPEVITAGGASLVEVGATNRTRAADYRAAISPHTRVLLRVHPSNFKVIGFTERPDRAALVALAAEAGLPLVEDLGSGLLGTGPGLPPGAEALEALVHAGVDLVCCSGDKLLGGPQAGLIVGKAAWVQRLRRHPLYRALRCDKLVLAALEATLRVHAEGRSDAVPVRAMIGASAASLRARAAALAAAIPGAVLEADVGFTGGGALPGEGLPTTVVAVRGGDPDQLAEALRRHDPPVMARVARDALLLDPRTLAPDEEAVVARAVRSVLAVAEGDG